MLIYIGLFIRVILLIKSLIIFTFVEIDQTDLRIGEDLLFIPPGDNRTCFEILAVDDTIIEDIEDVNVTVLPMNPNDSVMNEITFVTITDNDGIVIIIIHTQNLPTTLPRYEYILVL